MTPEEITKLAEEYANETVSMRHTTAIVADEAEDVIYWLLRTHCIVGKEKLRAMMSELDEDIRTTDTLKLAYTPAAQLQKGRMQGHSIGAKSALLNIFGAETFKNSDT